MKILVYNGPGELRVEVSGSGHEAAVSGKRGA